MLLSAAHPQGSPLSSAMVREYGLREIGSYLEDGELTHL